MTKQVKNGVADETAPAKTKKTAKKAAPAKDEKKAAPAESEKKAAKTAKAKTSGEGVVTLKALAGEANIAPQSARQKLRSAGISRPPGGRWGWEPGSKALSEARSALGL